MRVRMMQLTLLLALLFGAGSVQAAGWHAFSSKQLGFAVRYPATWKALTTARPGVQEVQVAYQGTTSYSLDVQVLSLKGGTAMRTFQSRFLAYEKRIGNSAMGAMRWMPTNFVGHHAIASVYAPATEGGTAVANGVYAVPWRSRTYVITIVALVRPTPKTVSQFPSIYRQVLATWRFL